MLIGHRRGHSEPWGQVAHSLPLYRWRVPMWQRGALRKRILDKLNRHHPALRWPAHPATSPSPGWSLSSCDKSQCPSWHAFSGLHQLSGLLSLATQRSRDEVRRNSPPTGPAEAALAHAIGQAPASPVPGQTTAWTPSRQPPCGRGHHGWPPCALLPVPHGGPFQATCLHLHGMRWSLPPRRCRHLAPSPKWLLLGTSRS